MERNIRQGLYCYKQHFLFFALFSWLNRKEWTNLYSGVDSIYLGVPCQMEYCQSSTIWYSGLRAPKENSASKNCVWSAGKVSHTLKNTLHLQWNWFFFGSSCPMIIPRHKDNSKSWVDFYPSSIAQLALGNRIKFTDLGFKPRFLSLGNAPSRCCPAVRCCTWFKSVQVSAALRTLCEQLSAQSLWPQLSINLSSCSLGKLQIAT